MSNEVFTLAKRRVIGSATMKAVILLMADSASDDGSGVWASKANIARDLELSKRAVQLAVQGLATAGIVFEVGKRRCLNGFTIEYSINLLALNSLPHTRESQQVLTGEPHSPVNTIHPTHAPRSPDTCTTFTQTILEPSLNHPKEREGLFDAKDAPKVARNAQGFDEFWNVYPKKKARPAAEKAFYKAIKNGADPASIITGAKRYALWLSSGGPKDFRPEAKFPQGWLNDERWNDADLPELPNPDAPRRSTMLRPFFGEVVR